MNNNLTGTAGAALDRLHPDQPGRTPRIGGDADRLTCAAMALVAVLRVAPDGLRIDDALITGNDGELTISLDSIEHARQLAARLGLGRPRVVELDNEEVLHRWRGTWADWPVTVQCLIREVLDLPPAVRGADVLAAVQP